MGLHAGFDVGGTNARLQLFDDHRQPVADSRRRIRDLGAPEEVAGALCAQLQAALTDADASPSQLHAIGLGLAAHLDATGRHVINSPNRHWQDVPFADLFEERLAADLQWPADERSVAVFNDLNAQLWGEYIDGAVQGVDDVLAVFVGTGIGGAILQGGQLMTGGGHNAGEIGHSKIVVGGRPCGCGEQGCVEAYAGGIHLERQVIAAAHDSRDSDHDFSHWLNDAGTDLAVPLSTADEHCRELPPIDAIWEQATDYLSIIVANACTLLNPSTLLLGGGVLEHCPYFVDRLLQKLPPLILQVARDTLSITMASHSDHSGMLGAADLALHHTS